MRNAYAFSDTTHDSSNAQSGERVGGVKGAPERKHAAGGTPSFIVQQTSTLFLPVWRAGGGGGGRPRAASLRAGAVRKRAAAVPKGDRLRATVAATVPCC